MCQSTSACAGRTQHKLSVTHPAATHWPLSPQDATETSLPSTDIADYAFHVVHGDVSSLAKLQSDWTAL